MKRVISLFMAVLMVFSMFAMLDTSAFAALKAPEGRIITSVKEYELAPGIKEQRIVSDSIAGNHQVKAYIAIADFNDPNVGFLAGYKDYDSSGTWGMQTVRDQARAASEAKGVKVVAGINADYFCMQDGNPVGLKQGQPYGALIMDGKVVNSPTGQPHYFAVLKDGTPVIRDSSEGWDDVEYAIGAPLRIVVGGTVIDNPDTALLPRCALGITADNKVIIYTADGRQAPTSVGETVYATAQMMKALGCVEAVYLDGGGSSTYASQTVDEAYMTVKSKPSDGTERKVSTTALLYYAGSSEEPTDKPEDTTPTDKPETPSCTHSWLPATCTAAKVCAICGEKEGSALGHKEIAVPGRPATCLEKGITDGKKCEICGVPTVVQKEIPMTGHTEEVIPAVAGTCLEKGLTEGKKCSVCGKVLVAQSETALGDHTLSDGKCTVCGKDFSEAKTLAKVKSLKVKKTTSTSATLSWKKVTGAESYKVYYSKNGKSWKSKTTKKTTLTIKKLSSATTYRFKVKAVADDAEGAFSSVVKGTTKFKTATLSKVTSSKKNTATVTWKKTTDASGYVVEYSTSKKFTKKTTKKVTIKKGKTTKTTLKKLKSGKKYYVRVKAYKTVSKKAVYGNYSSVKSVKVK